MRRFLSSLLIASVFLIAGFTAAAVLLTRPQSPDSANGVENGWETNQVLSDDGATLRFMGFALAAKDDLPDLFIEDSLVGDYNIFHTYSFINDFGYNTQFLRVDKMVIQYGQSWFNKATVLFRFNFEEQRYDPVLVSSSEQDAARFPQTEIISQDPLILRFYYDVARPFACYGPDCRVYWADHYRYDREKKEFISVNNEYREFFQELLNDYDDHNRSGCDSELIEGDDGLSLEDVYGSLTNYCRNSNREELEKFMSYWQMVKDIIR